jgi:hypothetical protein
VQKLQLKICEKYGLFLVALIQRHGKPGLAATHVSLFNNSVDRILPAGHHDRETGPGWRSFRKGRQRWRPAKTWYNGGRVRRSPIQPDNRCPCAIVRGNSMLGGFRTERSASSRQIASPPGFWVLHVSGIYFRIGPR